MVPLQVGRRVQQELRRVVGSTPPHPPCPSRVYPCRRGERERLGRDLGGEGGTRGQWGPSSVEQELRLEPGLLQPPGRLVRLPVHEESCADPVRCEHEGPGTATRPYRPQ